MGFLLKIPAKIDRKEMSVCKVIVVKRHIATMRKIDYIANRDHTGYRTPDALAFDAQNDRISTEDFASRVKEGWVWRSEKENKWPIVSEIILSVPDEFYRNEKYYQEAIRRIMKRFETKKSVKIDWIGAVHDPKGKSHVHVIINNIGNIEGKLKPGERDTRLFAIKRDDIYWFRNELKREMGMKWVKERYFENEQRISKQLRKNKAQWKEFGKYIEGRRKLNFIKNVMPSTHGNRPRIHDKKGDKFWALFGENRDKNRDNEKLFDR
ncbi:hypothetical protein LLE49_19850 [Alicyclobacillus tolerans]|uniref:hypothetical protein n=1 Tax=Alicyclobacillus tolerans TaxID=90970 RepID=UPI001F474A99|nr:hypothetical protein [Alicyclobacillus tolerans]MCF8566978.1 hypothetical protein [Alicyclobacillus tolerans]